MDKKQIQKIVGIVLTALLAIGAGLGWYFPVQVPQPTDEISAQVVERIGIDSRDDSYFYNGADLYFYSDGHATQVAHIDGGTGNLDVEGTLNVAGALDMSGALIISNTLSVVGAADAVQLTVTGYTTQTSDLVQLGGGLTDIGGGSYGTADGDNDLGVAADVEVDNTLDVDGDIDLDGDGFDVNITAGFSVDGDAASNINVAGAGIDLTLEAEAGRLILKGDEAAAAAVHIDANDAVTTGLDIDVGSVSGLTIDGGLTDVGGGTCGTADGDNDICVAADAEVDGVLDVDGSVDVDGTAFDVDITGGFSIDGDSGSNVGLSAGDITIEAETGSVTVKGDEANAAAVFIDANDAVTTGVDIDVGSVSGLTIDGGLTNIGGGTCATALGDNDLCVAGDIEVDGTIVLANTNFPLGYASSGEQAVLGTSAISATGTITHGLTTPTYGLCTLSGQMTDNEEQKCSVNISGAVVTIYVYKEDGTAGDSAVNIFWMVVGTP